MSCRTLQLLALIVVAAVNSARAKDGGRDEPAGYQPSASAPRPSPAALPAAVHPVPPRVHPSSSGADTALAPVDPKSSVRGIIALSAALEDDVKPGDAVFLVARRAGGPPGPASMLAVQKLTVGDFPMTFTLSSRDAMIPGTPFEGEVSITARVDKDGNAMTRRKGDVFGSANDIEVGNQDVVIHLDALQTEDETLGAPGAASSRIPAGSAPGKP